MAYFQCGYCDDIVPCRYTLDAFGRRVYNLRQRVCDTCHYGPPTPEPKLDDVRRRIIREDDAEKLSAAVEKFVARRREVVRSLGMEVDAAKEVWDCLLCRE